VAIEPSVRVLIDTNIAVFLAQGREYAERYRRHLEGRITALSFASAAELLLTARRSTSPDRMLAYWREKLPYYVVLFPDLETCDIWARVVAFLRAKGTPRQDNDMWIAATALRHNLPLITHNPRDFADIEGLQTITEQDEGLGIIV
jgi:tRNA(fMet)-specific endonuclease VapC